jgi:alpha-1,3-mannosylglycoprotein beta-1,4-N-acetylglucosaminyltransferase C
MLTLKGVVCATYFIFCCGIYVAGDSHDACHRLITERATIVPHVGVLNTSSFNTSKFFMNNAQSYKVSVTGIQRETKGFLTIGISSVRRINGPDYLLQTLASLIDRTSTSEQSNITVVVFLADGDPDYNKQSSNAILEHYEHYVNTGFIRIINVSADYYPQLDGLKRNFGDSPDRVKWRAKQVADFVLLFTYSRNISTYYLQLEDDVVCARGFVTAIRRYIDMQSAAGKWTTLEFSELGFIGKLFRSDDLDQLIEFMSMFYAEQPVDWLISYFRLSVGHQQNVLLRKPTLFQHFGTKSSFDLTKDNPLVDRFFDAGDGVWSSADNPPATVVSTMPHFKGHLPEMAYSSGNGYFWATKSNTGDSVHVIFDVAQNLSRIVVLTGSPDSPADALDKGSVYISSSVTVSAKGQKICEQPGQLVAVFSDGHAVAEQLEETVHSLTRCIIITVDSDQNHWVLFARIAVFTVASHSVV